MAMLVVGCGGETGVGASTDSAAGTGAETLGDDDGAPGLSDGAPTGSGGTGSTGASADDDGDTTAGASATGGTSAATRGDDSGDDSDGGEESSGSDDDSGGPDGPEPVELDPDGALFVRDDGLNSNPGTMDAPLRTIQWALDRASDQPGVDTIYVAEGTYATQNANNDTVVMLSGVSLRGGYSADWTQRDPDVFVSRVEDSSPQAAGAFAVIDIPADVGPQTVLEGFTIVVGSASGATSRGVAVHGDARVENNRFVANADILPGADLTAVNTSQGSPTITGNRIDFDNDVANVLLVGINVVASSADIINNTIILRGGETQLGLNATVAADPYIAHNSVVLGEAAGYGLQAAFNFSVNDSSWAINNVLDTAEASSACVRKSTQTTEDTVLLTNAMHCSPLLQEPDITYATMADLEDEFGYASGNVALAETLFGDASDLSLDATDPCGVTMGGTFVAAIAEDLDGQPRTEPVSIGALEWDGECF